MVCLRFKLETVNVLKRLKSEQIQIDRLLLIDESILHTKLTQSHTNNSRLPATIKKSVLSHLHAIVFFVQQFTNR